jgi:transcription antitermination factor NusB
MRKRSIARECVLKILYQVEIKKDEPEEVIAQFWEDNPVDKEISDFANRIVKGTLAHLEEIDTVLSRHTDNWDLARMAILDRNILRLGAYEILFLEDIPPKVTINESVNIAKKYSQEDSGKFVNGVLDHINHNEKPFYSQP